jgi:hypothetical protein
MLYWKILAPAAVAAAGVIAAALLTKKLANKGDGAAEKPAPAVKPAAKPYAPKAPAVGSYSFISGFQDAATVEVSVPFDAESFSFAVLEDGFLCESGDSHVGLLSGEKFSAQFEYGTYYRGEDFGELQGQLAEKHKDLRAAVYGENAGVCFRDGDNISLCFPILGDSHSYLHVTLVKAADNDDELEDLLGYPELRYTLGGLRSERR